MGFVFVRLLVVARGSSSRYGGVRRKKNTCYGADKKKSSCNIRPVYVRVRSVVDNGAEFVVVACKLAQARVQGHEGHGATKTLMVP